MTKPTKRRKRYVVGAITCGLSFLAAEVFLRTAVGLATPALFIADNETGYRFKPNQSVTRLGNHIIYNQYSQRSDTIESNKPDNTLRILMVGDSVLNGGSHITQSDTITEKLETKLLEQHYPAEVLNASAGSWGIGNLKGYLEKFGTFQSDIVILQIGSHDLVQPMSTSDAVGRASHPDKSPILATQALIANYIWPQVSKRFSEKNKLADEIPDAVSPEQQFRQNMDSLSELAQTLAEQEVPLYILHTPARADALSSDRTSEHKAAFTQKLTDLNLPLIDVQATWIATPAETVNTYFRDRVHLSTAGNEAIAELLHKRLIAAPAVTKLSNDFPSK